MRVLGSIVVSIPACHAADRASIRRVALLYLKTNICLIGLKKMGDVFLWATSNLKYQIGVI